MINPIPFKLVPGSAAELRLKRYLKDRVVALRQGLEKLHGLQGVVKWRKAYEAIPAEEIREFPWHGASNLVVPIIGIHTDTLLARVMAGMFKTKPMWMTKAIGDFEDKEELKSSYEEYMEYVALESSELDLYRVERDWFSDIIKLGLGVIKVPWVEEFIDVAVPSGDGTGKFDYDRKTVYQGPRPEKLRYEDFKYPVNVSTLEAMDFKYHVIHLQRHQLEERQFRKIYDFDAVQRMLNSPDRTGPDVVQTQKEQDANVSTVSGYGFQEWDVCECHFKYRVEHDKFCKVIVWYHEKTDQILRSFHYYYPDEIFIAGRLFYRDDMFAGRGFAETLAPIQEEISEIHNQRRDNMTISNMKMFRVDPDSELNKGYKIYPGANLPAKKDEVEPLDAGTPVTGEIDSENQSINYSERLSGVTPPMQGAGAGQTKRGIYTTMGTLSVIQEGNTRTDLNITDIRYAHTKLGRILSQEYAMFGMGDRQRMFGKKGELIKKALDAMIDGRMALPVYASTASVNREIEKQNDMLLTGVSERYHQSIAAMLAQANNPMTPPPVRDYIVKAIKAANILMKSVYSHFGYDELDQLAPKPIEGQPPQPTLQQMPQMPPQMQQQMPQFQAGLPEALPEGPVQ